MARGLTKNVKEDEKQKDSGFREQKLGFNGEIDVSKMRPTVFPSN